MKPQTRKTPGGRWQLASLLALAAAPLYGAAEGPAAEPLRVMTFNIRYAEPADGTNRWENRRAAVAALIDAECDLAGLQEVLAGQLAALRSALPDFDVVSRGRERNAREGEACPVFYRRARLECVASGTFWLSGTPAVAGSRDWGNGLPRICTWAELRDRRGGGRLRVYNLHLDNAAAEARRRGLALVRGQAEAAGGPAIVLGDCNEAPGAPAVAAMERAAGWRDAWRQRGQGEGGTFNGWRPSGPYPRIDYIFYRGEELRAEACRVAAARTAGGGWTSDHFPVLASFGWLAAPRGQVVAQEDGSEK